MTSIEVYRAVYDVLRQCGVPPSSKANPIIAEAVVQYQKDSGAIFGGWTARMLPAIGAVMGISGDAAERLITRAINACFDLDGGEAMRQRLKTAQGQKPKARDLIMLISEAIQ